MLKNPRMRQIRGNKGEVPPSEIKPLKSGIRVLNFVLYKIFWKEDFMKNLTTKRLIFCILFLNVFFITQTSFANKASVTISAPETAAKGSEVLIKLTITHSSNNFF